MKKAFKYYIAGWAVALALFNLIAFLLGGVENEVKYTSQFWIGYVFITLVFIGQLVVSYFALNQSTAKKTFYNIPLVGISYTGLIVSLVFGALSMAIPVFPYWVGVIVDVIVTAVVLVSVIKAKAAADIVSEMDETVKKQTQFIKMLTADAETLMAKAIADEAKAETKKVYEAIRYSDPMSNTALADIESRISIAFGKFSDAVTANGDCKAAAEELILLVTERNDKCKLLK